ncbi:MAG: hypothetical protein ACO1OT_09835, partial [Heyndrickxia sp.]
RVPFRLLSESQMGRHWSLRPISIDLCLRNGTGDPVYGNQQEYKNYKKMDYRAHEAGVNVKKWIIGHM